jgi:HTH-type transcriptional regulator/antitoxin HipB
MDVRSIHDLAAAVRGRRSDFGLSQSELAVKARVSRKWLNEFEAGKPTAELGLVLRVLDVLALQLSLEPKGEGELPQGAPINLDTLLTEYESRDE